MRSPFYNLPCPYCGQAMTTDVHQRNAANYSTRDHIIPRRSGGKEVIRVCRACNEDKYFLTLNEWRLVLSLRHRRPFIFHFEKCAVRLYLLLAVMRLPLLAI